MPIQLSALRRIGLTAVAAEGAGTTLPIARGRRVLVVARVIARLLWIALRGYRNPLRALKAIGGLRVASRHRQWANPSSGQDATPAFWLPKMVAASGRTFWEMYEPGFPSRAFDRFIVHELARVDPAIERTRPRLGRPPALNTAIIAITRRCALSCEHCFEWDALAHDEALSTDELHEIVQRVRNRGVVQLFFSGGEPLQRFDDLLSLALTASADTDVWVLTSGLGLTSDKARRLRAAGVTGLSLSLDHWDPPAHDQFRGLAGSFAAVERAAHHAREAGLVVALSLCPTRAFVTRENLDRYARTAQSLGASFIQIIEPKAAGRYDDMDVALGPAHHRVLEAFCARLNTHATARDLPTVDYVDWASRQLGCCGAGDRYVYIDTDGDLHACPFCRSPGLSVLDHDLDTAIALLSCSGCSTDACAQPIAAR